MSYFGNFNQSQPTLNQLLSSNISINNFLKNQNTYTYNNYNNYDSSSYNYQPLGNHYNRSFGGVIGCVGSAHENLSILPTISAPK
jgi:hypothetical protein